MWFENDVFVIIDELVLDLGVDFIKVGHTAQIIKIALSICALRQLPTFEMLFTGVDVQGSVQKIGAGRKTVYEIDSRSGVLS